MRDSSARQKAARRAAEERGMTANQRERSAPGVEAATQSWRSPLAGALQHGAAGLFEVEGLVWRGPPRRSRRPWWRCPAEERGRPSATRRGWSLTQNSLAASAAVGLEPREAQPSRRSASRCGPHLGREGCC
jgi:hypothetical protein